MKANRRDFLKAGLAGIAAAALPSCSGGTKENRSASESPEKKHTFVERTLGRTGIGIPIISMGGVATDKSTLRAALDAGIRHIDTDYTYRNGWHERLVGEVIKDRPRESVIVATKVNTPSYNGGTYREGTRGEEETRHMTCHIQRSSKKSNSAKHVAICPVVRVALLVGLLFSVQRVFAAEGFLVKTNLFEAGKEGYALYRIPGVVVTNNGTVLAYCEARKKAGGDWGDIDIMMRRSPDGGTTWEER